MDEDDERVEKNMGFRAWNSILLRRYYWMAMGCAESFGIGHDDRVYITMPVYHSAAGEHPEAVYRKHIFRWEMATENPNLNAKFRFPTSFSGGKDFLYTASGVRAWPLLWETRSNGNFFRVNSIVSESSCSWK